MDLLSHDVQQTKPLIHKGFCWEIILDNMIITLINMIFQHEDHHNM